MITLTLGDQNQTLKISVGLDTFSKNSDTFLSICFEFTIYKSVEVKLSPSTSFSFVMFAGPFAMIFYGVQIFQETGETN